MRIWHFLNTTTKDLEFHFDGDWTKSSSTEQNSRHEPLGLSLRHDPLPWKIEIRPCSHTICSSSTLVDNALYNPYRYLILPMALESQALYHATLAIAANTLKLSDPRYRLPALEHHHRALSHLRNLLSQDSWAEKELDEMLGLVLMLCWFDISDSSRPSWVTHLNGFQDLSRTRQRRPGRSPHSQDLASFFDRYFAFHLVLARTSFRINDLPCQSPLLPDSLLENSDTIDPYMGFSHSLLLLINQVAELAWNQADNQKCTHNTAASRLRKSLEGLDQILPSQCDDPNTECAAIAEANRLGALLLLQEISSSKSASTNNLRQQPTGTQEKTHYVKLILNLMLEKKANMMRTAVLPLWPLFLAGCCASGEEERITVMQFFDEVEGIHRFGNVAPAMEVIEMVWRQQDLSVQDERKRQRSVIANEGHKETQKFRFPWEHAMLMLGNWKLSLT
ncbi:transcriptional regulator family: Fungal Specific TF [Penicillium cosmopolitanum]|uniref:Transcriptional regulator family: Fungal Specific TF n=1 Tax=Penicillium cosmopolitanum TaxID=1131564 RepID=A0A9W9VE85_9EURO|nr:transcriptional regulator family: Fungal Specific TF [Penicillium cosmopolitanum]KAJ5378747.1 transcriptional regulator family: Fungal Specific TF [Penicillium cosmopolitanum]